MIQQLSKLQDHVQCSHEQGEQDLQDLQDTPQAGTSMSTRWISTIAELEQLAGWERLVEMTLRENMTYGPDLLIPAFRHLGNERVKILVIESQALNSPGETVPCGLIPVIESRLFGLPWKCLEVWKHAHCFDTTPLIRRDCATDVVIAGLQAMKATGAKLVQLDTFGVDAGVAEVLQDAIEELGWGYFRRRRFARAMFRPRRSLEDYWADVVSKNVRKKYARLVRKVEELGCFEVHVSNSNSNFSELSQSFLDLEAAGWKGREGTALKMCPRERAFFEEMVANSASNGRIKFLSLLLDGKPIAILCDLYSGKFGCSFKTAFDEDFSKYSPGWLAEMKNIEFMHEAGVVSMDSCTLPDNETINRIWGDKAEFECGVVALGRGLPKLLTAVLPGVQWAFLSLKQRFARD